MQYWQQMPWTDGSQHMSTYMLNLNLPESSSSVGIDALQDLCILNSMAQEAGINWENNHSLQCWIGVTIKTKQSHCRAIKRKHLKTISMHQICLETPYDCRKTKLLFTAWWKFPPRNRINQKTKWTGKPWSWSRQWQVQKWYPNFSPFY